MAENPEQSEGTQQNQNQAVGEGLVPSPSGELTAIKAQLEQAEVARNEANQAKAALEEAAAAKDSRIAELQAEGEALRAERSNLEAALSEVKAEVLTLSEAKQTTEAEVARNEAISAELAAASEAKNQAVAKYLSMAKALNPNIPEGIIGGESIAEIDASVEKGKAIVEAVKKAMESEASAARVPAGAPTRSGIPTEGMSPKEKIAYAITSLRGTQ